MIKEFVLKVYLTVFKTIFSIFNIRPLKNRTVLLASFGDNIQHVINELNKETQQHIVVLKDPTCHFSFKQADQSLNFSLRQPIQFLKGIYYLATSKYIFIDNYQVVLAACDFRSQVTCTQLWHANGAVKYFGLRDKTIKSRPQSAHDRFRDVYKRFHKVVVSSDDMAYIFKEAFDLRDENILKTGLPRTDYYFNQALVSQRREELRSKLNIAKEKKVVLYAPTYRDGQLDEYKLPLDFKQLEQALPDYYFLVKLHPAVQECKVDDSNFVKNVSHGYKIEDLMATSDILITDYSSIPFEYSIFNKPMVFFVDDIETYEEEKGIWFDYEKYMPGPVVKTNSDLISVLKENKFNLEDVKIFNHRVNQYADGQATKKLIQTLYK
ncbi:CDP-glycerol glycerophosphotransferase family protein [Jeotgalicoccus sp. ATCC 8456]|uniref:CDP-glycerol glycerophosphotransferase family protein n=1 Tax=Jeotgalicoccus sp. ATCC 8456 TaxID=946435 RepID=UPI0018E6374F|nr:CDP-glycerol glycerophosphotransferase family protein [Jeotgalicoccus sp. ATCC 8456]QQD85868.1 CDP-glycerol glycerophosphotransferase family protein [Jeotgalicoccus sp. ATCC 8456]